MNPWLCVFDYTKWVKSLKLNKFIWYRGGILKQSLENKVFSLFSIPLDILLGIFLFQGKKHIWRDLDATL